MTDDKKKSELETKKLKKQKENMSIVSLLMMAGGLLVLLFGAFPYLSWGNMEFNDKYLTDPDIPHSEWANATWTITHDQVHEEASRGAWIALAGGVLAFFGIGLTFSNVLIPSEKYLHQVGCTGEGKPKYCPECGVKLSRLKERDD